MPINRYQRGGVYLRKGKTGIIYYGTYRRDNPDGSRQPVQVKLGTVAELPTKSDARKKLDTIIAKASEPGAATAFTELKTFSTLAEEWKKCEGGFG